MKKYLNDGPFNRISRDVITNPELSLKAKGLLTLILGFPDDWDFSLSGLQPFLKEGRESIQSALKELIEKGYAVKESSREANGRFTKNGYSFTEKPFADNPETEDSQQLRSIESISSKIKNIKIEKLLAHEPFLKIWEKLTATPKWMKKNDAQIEKELEELSAYELDEATALVQEALNNLWGKAIYDESSVRIVTKVRKERPKTFVPNHPTPTPPPLSPEETARRNKEALDCSARQIFEDLMKNGHIIGSTDITVAAVFDHLLEEGVIHLEQPRLDEIAAQETDKARRTAKRQVLQETLVQMQADGKGLEFIHPLHELLNRTSHQYEVSYSVISDESILFLFSLVRRIAADGYYKQLSHFLSDRHLAQDFFNLRLVSERILVRGIGLCRKDCGQGCYRQE